MTKTSKAFFRKKAILFLLLLTSTSILMAAQTTKMSASLKQATLREVFSNIETQTDLLFFYVDADIANIKVNLSVKDKAVEDVLKEALRNTGLNYSIEGKNVNIYKASVPAVAQDDRRRITGRVSDANGEPLPGVNIVEEGTTNGTVTDFDGLYELNLTQRTPQIIYNYIGFEPQTIRVGGASVYDIYLNEAINELDEMVVVGYGQQRKISSIGAQSSLKTSDIKTPAVNLSSVLAGRIAGVVAVQRTGEPGRDASDIWIRGITTSNNANPLVLVDGVERSFNNLDPDDIESITVLKDASATAVYGVRGANGVIVVKTKPGIIGKPSVSIDYYEGFNKMTKRPKLADGLTYMNVVNEALINSGQTPKYSDEYIANTRSGADQLLYPNVDWQKEVFKDWSHSRRVNANIRGGSQMAQFYTSVTYTNEGGLVKTNPYENYNSNTQYHRYNILSNLTVKLTESTTVDVGVQGYLGDGNYSGESAETIFNSTMEVNPVMYPKMFVVDGKEYVPGVHTQGSERNPYADATKRGYRKIMDNRIQSNIRVAQDLDFITKGLKAIAMFAFDVESKRQTKFGKRENTYYFADRENEPYDENGNPILTATWNNGSDILGFDGGDDYKLEGYRKDNFEFSFVYDRAFGNGDHRVGGMVIYTQQNKVENHAGSLIGSIPYRLQGVAGRATYSWKDKYFGEFNIGYNGGENFPKDRRFGTFPAFGLGWVLSNESFWEPLQNVVPFFKVRYTNGKVGNSTVDGRRFMYLEQYQWQGDRGYDFGNMNGYDGAKVSNPATALGWEIAHKQDLGFDIHMFNDELVINFDLFKERRTDILLKRDNSIAGFTGFEEVPFGNVGVTKSKGFDGNIEYYKRINKDWGLTLRGNMTYADPVWVDNDIPDKPYAWRNRRGQSLTSIEGFTAEGLYTQADIDKIQAWIAGGSVGDAPFPTPYKVSLSQVQAGDIKYADLNKDGKIDDDDKSWLGNGDVPKISYGFGFNLDYKAFSLGVLFQGTGKANRFVGGFAKPLNGSGSGNVFSNIDDRWTEDNPSQDVFYPRLAYGSDAAGNMNNFENSTWWLKDMSFLRLKNLQVSYRLPEAWCRKVYIKNASVYMMGSNVFTLSKWKLWDPELNTDTGNKYPNTTSYTVGLNFSF